MSLDYLFVDAASVREYLLLNDVPSSSRYTDATIGSNIRAAASHLERVTGRFFADRPATSYQFTSQGRASVAIPGVRNPATVSVLYQGSALNVAVPPSNEGACWLIPDAMQTGVYTALQVRVFRSLDMAGGWWKANSEWFDRALDSPFFPGNYGGGYGFNSMPNDLGVTGDWGYAAADRPEPLLMATKQLAAWLTVEPTAVLANVGETPSGRPLLYAAYPLYVQGFIAEWRVGEQAVTIG